MRAVVFLISMILMVSVAACNFSPPAPPRQPSKVAEPDTGGFPALPADEKPKDTPKPLGDDTNNNKKIDSDERNAAAVGVFQDTVIQYCRWMIVLVTIASVGALILSFTPWSIMSAGKSLIGFAAVAVIMVGQLALLLWGEFLANMAGVLTIVSTIIAFGMLVWYVVTAVQTRIEIRRKKSIEEQARQLAAEGHGREATALFSVINPVANERRSEVAAIINSLSDMDDKAKAKALAKLKEWGVMVDE